jgi:hypothetical protein
VKLSRRDLGLGALALAACALVVVGRRREVEPGAAASAPDPRSEVAAPFASAPARSRPDEIGVASLLAEMLDLARLAKLPDPPYTAHLASSYDRRSRSVDEAEGWFANDDWASAARPNYERIETREGRREYVLLDVKGPGAIVRLWTATPTGTLRIYFDGASAPALEARLGELLSGENRFPRGLAYVAERGYNSYFPLPFRAGCKVTIDELVATDPFRGGPLEKFYYQINYRRYAPQTAERVRTFTLSDLTQHASLIAGAVSVLERPDSVYRASAERRLEFITPTSEESRLSLTSTHGSAIRELVLRVRDTSDEALRRARLSLTFDDEPPVETPLGDFFGGGPGLSPHNTLPLEVRADGTLRSRFVMPFQKRALLVVRGSPGIEGEMSVEPWEWDAHSLYFRAAWQPSQRTATRPFRDLTLLSLRGQGVYVGNAFSLRNPTGARWWGEGDDKVYVDGEHFPSLFGTGTEDYYGYAWSGITAFSRAFHALTRAEGPGFGGRSAMNRFHFLDAVPFTSDFRFDLELWHWEELEVSWDAMAYYYVRPGAEQLSP